MNATRPPGPAPRPAPAGTALRRAAPPLALGAAVLALAEGAARLGLVSDLVLPAPSAVGRALAANAPDLAAASAQTLLETALGLGIAVALGVLAALLLQRFPAARRAVMPWLVVSQTIPLVALAPLLLVWLGFGLLPKVIVVVLVCFFPIAVATQGGLERTDPLLLAAMRSWHATPARTDRLLRFPAALPAFFSGLRLAATYAVTGAIFGESVGGYAGLGILVTQAANARATDLVFAAIFLSALYSVLLVALVNLAARLALRGRPPEARP